MGERAGEREKEREGNRPKDCGGSGHSVVDGRKGVLVKECEICAMGTPLFDCGGDRRGEKLEK